jgi:hypothetical protein
MYYRSIGTSGGIEEFVGAAPGYEPLTNYGLGEVTLDTATYRTLRDQGKDVLHVPVAITGVGMYHSVTGEPTS